MPTFFIKYFSGDTAGRKALNILNSHMTQLNTISY